MITIAEQHAGDPVVGNPAFRVYVHTHIIGINSADMQSQTQNTHTTSVLALVSTMNPATGSLSANNPNTLFHQTIQNDNETSKSAPEKNDFSPKL